MGQPRFSKGARVRVTADLSFLRYKEGEVIDVDSGPHVQYVMEKGILKAVSGDTPVIKYCVNIDGEGEFWFSEWELGKVKGDSPTQKQ